MLLLAELRQSERHGVVPRRAGGAAGLDFGRISDEGVVHAMVAASVPVKKFWPRRR